MLNILSTLEIVNYGLVLFFGIVLSLQLSDIPFKENKALYIATLLGFALLQMGFYFFIEKDLLYKSYPFLIHLPLGLLIKFGFKKNGYLTIIAVLSAYLFCTPRKCLGTFIASFYDYSPVVSNIVEILVTLPLLFFIVKFVPPFIIRLKYESKTILRLFMILPVTYYILEYTFTVYTDLLYTGGAAVVEFIDASIVLLYFVFSMVSLHVLSQKKKTDEENIMLNTIANQSQKEIAQLRVSEKQAAIYRHDLRHHLNFIGSCIRENKMDTAMQYINNTCANIESTQFITYCQNDFLNLILSSYIDKAAKQNITVDIVATATNFDRFEITDICSLLSNTLENAINACMLISKEENRHIKLNLYERNNHLCFQIRNNYEIEPLFHDDIPISHERNHGIGVKSIVFVVDKYEGVYNFSAKNGEFCFQASL
ncbi:MAG: ATP-binding protein [Oscillospiraceae bacterium]|nr:ATP-binding protein [Oscillospiraceae bacterium]